jgi:hypothetical protein
MTTKEMVEAEPKAKREIEVRIDQLRKLKRKPEDWIFVPRRKSYESATVILEDAEVALVSDGSGGFKTHTKRPALRVKVPKVHFVDPKGVIHGGFRPSALGAGAGAWTAQKVLEAFIELSLNPKCEVVPYECREMTKDVKDAQNDLLVERRARLEAEDKLRAMEDGDAKKTARLKELEDQVSELTKPAKK